MSGYDIASNKLKSISNIFGPVVTEDKDNAQVQIPVSKLMPFGYDDSKRQAMHVFSPYPQDKLEELAEDISANGVLNALLVRLRPDSNYEILAGHNRYNAAKLAGLESVPCRVMDVDDDQAIIIMTTTNLNQRDNISPLELGFAYKHQLEAIARQKENNKEMAITTGAKPALPKTSIYRYVRLTYLIKEWAEQVTSEKLPVTVGANISYLSKAAQYDVWAYLEENKIKLNLAISENLKKTFTDKERITTAQLDSFFSKKKNSKPPSAKTRGIGFTISAEKQKQYFAGKSQKEIQLLVEQILDAHFAQSQK